MQWLQNKLNEHVKTVSEDTIMDDKHSHEMVRFSDSKVHSVSAFLGGVASQEVIKILIKQYTIFNSTLIYDGINGRLQTFE